MQLELYKAFLSINMPEDVATKLVDAMNAHIDTRVTAAGQAALDRMDVLTARLEAKLEALVQSRREADAKAEKAEARAEAAAEVRRQRFRWVVTSVLTGVGVTLAVLKALGVPLNIF
jgi:regulator of protease activity HflC (stomatin/prohibitin superfamily)